MPRQIILRVVDTRNQPKVTEKIQEKPIVRFQEPDESGDEDDDLLEEPPKNRYARRQSVCAEAYNPDESDDDDEQMVIHPKSDAQRKRLNEAVKNILLFKNLDAEELNQVLDAMFERKTTPGEHIIDQGDDGDNFYIIDRGVFDIYVKIDGNNKKVGAYNNKGSFGELALMYNTPRAATIVASSEGIIWALDRVIFRKIVLKAAYNRRRMHEGLLEKVPMLKHLNEFERMNVADALETKTFEDGDRIIKQGDEADYMYFIERGVAVVKMTSPNTGSKEVEITQLQEGGYFGELALVTHKPRAASVYAVGAVRLAALDILAFERLLGSCMEVMKRNFTDYEEQLNKLGLSNRDLRGK
ncbi:cAMP-dependent protein kinase type II regulatory subunit-like isoform X2 [Hydractinia symbiolongicarpus]|uniref:cAMP-dependent protein kinase type II regulatory subunit-like isoform X2 n=1 Tax=Hydractinia symbiolongicarpus TaxID=13093 RepID=UPI00254C81AE|nr:cAMP-dependent protein kinase type II regulatory subunit-like isoform X2 [Hydractinia symbiolongicarpus]